MSEPLEFEMQGFRRYLDALPPGYQVGYCNDPTRCPLAMWQLKRRADLFDIAIHIGSWYAWLLRGRVKMNGELPPWALLFIWRVDHGEQGDSTSRTGVTRERALAIIDDLITEGVSS